MREKQQQDAAETAKLISKRHAGGARPITGIDGGMNKVFAAKLPDGSTGLSEGGDGQGLSLLALSRAPGTIPVHRQSAAGPNADALPEEPPAALAGAGVAASPRATRVAIRGADRRNRTASSPASPARSASAARHDDRPRARRRRRPKPKVIEAKRTEPR